MPKTNDPDPHDSNYASFILSQLCSGETQAVLSEAINDCVAASSEFNAPASLTFTMKFSPKKGKLIIEDHVKTKLPTETRISPFHVGKGGVLTRRNPNQRHFEFDGDDEPVPVPRGKAAAANDS